MDDEPPILRSRILAWFERREAPALVSEIAQALEVPHESLTAVLIRMVRAGFLERLKAPMVFPRHPQPGTTLSRRVWLYRAA